jgi:hypothetical protein
VRSTWSCRVAIPCYLIIVHIAVAAPPDAAAIPTVCALSIAACWSWNFIFSFANLYSSCSSSANFLLSFFNSSVLLNSRYSLASRVLTYVSGRVITISMFQELCLTHLSCNHSLCSLSLSTNCSFMHNRLYVIFFGCLSPSWSSYEQVLLIYGSWSSFHLPCLYLHTVKI